MGSGGARAHPQGATHGEQGSSGQACASARLTLTAPRGETILACDAKHCRRRPAVDTQFEDAKKLVVATIRKLGIDPSTAVAPATPGSAAWTLKRGSASILVALNHHDDERQTYL